MPHITDLALSCRTIHNTYTTTYSEQQLHRADVEGHFDIRQGICVEPAWKRAQGPRHGEGGEYRAGERGWSTRFWVPIPMAMFETTDSRAFEIGARVRVRFEDGAGKGEEVEFGATMETSVSSLRLDKM